MRRKLWKTEVPRENAALCKHLLAGYILVSGRHEKPYVRWGFISRSDRDRFFAANKNLGAKNVN